MVQNVIFKLSSNLKYVDNKCDILRNAVVALIVSQFQLRTLPHVLHTGSYMRAHVSLNLLNEFQRV